MTQTKRDTLVLQAGGWGVRLTTPLPQKYLIVEKANNGCQLNNSSKRARRSYKTMIYILFLARYSVCIEQEC